jgi:hypothetical protein
VTFHRWSGWPGAFCLDCGAEDANEVCIALHDEGLICECGEVCCLIDDHKLKGCSIHKNDPCPTPGARNFDPYMKRA